MSSSASPNDLKWQPLPAAAEASGVPYGLLWQAVRDGQVPGVVDVSRAGAKRKSYRIQVASIHRYMMSRAVKEPVETKHLGAPRPRKRRGHVRQFV